MNGCLAGFFRSSRALRQGDPLSSLLFIMVSEVLSKMISQAEVGFLPGFMVGVGVCRISHLQFADDTIIFCDADVRQLGYLRCILCCFKTNLAKSKLFFIGDVPDIESLAWILGYKVGSLRLPIWGCRWVKILNLSRSGSQ